MLEFMVKGGRKVIRLSGDYSKYSAYPESRQRVPPGLAVAQPLNQVPAQPAAGSMARHFLGLTPRGNEKAACCLMRLRSWGQDVVSSQSRDGAAASFSFRRVCCFQLCRGSLRCFPRMRKRASRRCHPALQRHNSGLGQGDSLPCLYSESAFWSLRLAYCGW